jgi:nucleotide-binding universal stress UspA family protein
MLDQQVEVELRGSRRKSMYSRIVVPLDGSPFAEQALSQAIGLARLTAADVHLVRVADIHRLDHMGAARLPVDESAVGPLLAEESTDASVYLDEVQDRLRRDGVDASVEVVRGPVARAIVDLTRAGDLIVMASHGRAGVARWFLGSVAEDVLRRANVPILLVRVDHASTATTPSPA